MIRKSSICNAHTRAQQTQIARRYGNASQCRFQFTQLRPLVCTVLFLGTAGLPWVACGQGQTDTIAITGDAAPDGNGSFSTFSDPVINSSGQTAFEASLTGTIEADLDNGGIFRGNGGVITQIAREGQLAPDGNGNYLNFGAPTLNDSGRAAFLAHLIDTNGVFTDNQGIFSGNGGGITQIARKSHLAPDGNGTYAIFWAGTGLVSNNSGQAAFYATLSDTNGASLDDSGIFRGNGGFITQIAREGQAAPDSNGVYSNFGAPKLNDQGQAAFSAFLTGTSGSVDDQGLFRGNGAGITQIVRGGQLAPDGNGTFFGAQNYALNNMGQVAFIGSLMGTSGESSDDSGIFRGSGGGITQIAREGQTAPDGNGTIASFGIPVLNDSGQAAFFATVAGTSAGFDDDSGIFRSSGFGITQIAREGQVALDGNGAFSSFWNATINNSGQTAYFAQLTDTSGGNSDDRAIYTGDGIDSFRVAREGDSVAGSTITSFSFYSPENNLNDFGQIAYRAVLASGNEVIRRWTPDLNWRTNSSGSWNSSSNWTLGLNPGFVHDVYIDPEASLTVYGPTTDTSVHNLFVGTDGVTPSQGQVTLYLQQGRTIDVDNVMIIGSSGTLTGDGRITGAAGVFNDGRIIANNIVIDGPINSLGNGGTGVIEGSGRVHANIFNSGSIRANDGNVLRLTGPALTNLGVIEVIGGEIEVAANLQNSGSSSLITGRDATMRFDGGVTNNGGMAFSFGTSDVFGDIDNTGAVSIGGGAEVTFYDDITQNGSFEVVATGSRTSSAVVFGEFSGAGGFTGGGDVFLLGDLRPGNSPDSVLMDGNLYLGASTESLFEIGGLDQGEFDQLIVTGDLNLAGDLSVGLLDGFRLGINQEFLIADVSANLFGQFTGLSEGSLVGNYGGHDLFITYSAGSGNDVALFTSVPEPGAIGLLLFGSMLMACRIRRRK